MTKQQTPKFKQLEDLVFDRKPPGPTLPANRQDKPKQPSDWLAQPEAHPFVKTYTTDGNELTLEEISRLETL